MRATRCEQALRRVLAWLRWSGSELNPQMEQAVLRALSDAVAANECDLFAATLCRLTDSGVLPAAVAVQLPCGGPTPALRRSSIGYGSY